MRLIKPNFVFAICFSSMLACELEEPNRRTVAPDYGLPNTVLSREAGEEASEEAGEEAGEEANNGIEWPNLKGLWQIEHVTTMRSELPVIMEEVETKIQATMLAELTQDQSELWLHHKICDVHMSNTPAYNQTIIPDLFIESLPIKTRKAHLSKLRGPNNMEMGRFELIVDYWHDLRSISLDDPYQDLLPSDASDPRIFDQDQDGKPGLTANLIGFPEGSVSLIQKSSDEWRALISIADSQSSINEISGLITWQEEQQIIEASNDVLLIEVRRWVPEESELHYFEMKRIDDFVCPPRREIARPQSK